MLHQTSTYLPPAQWVRYNAEGRERGEDFSVLDELEHCRAPSNGKLQLKLAWPGFADEQGAGADSLEWKQTTNPVTVRAMTARAMRRPATAFARAANRIRALLLRAGFAHPRAWAACGSRQERQGGGVEGYEPLGVNERLGRGLWRGLEHNGDRALLDGHVDARSWWFAVGSAAPFHGGIPGPTSEVVTDVQLFALCPRAYVDPCPPDTWERRAAAINAACCAPAAGGGTGGCRARRLTAACPRRAPAAAPALCWPSTGSARRSRRSSA